MARQSTFADLLVPSSDSERALSAAASARLTAFLDSRAFSPADGLEAVTDVDLEWAMSNEGEGNGDADGGDENNNNGPMLSGLGMRSAQLFRAVASYMKLVDTENRTSLAQSPVATTLVRLVRTAIERGTDFPPPEVLHAAARRCGVSCERLWHHCLLDLGVLHALGLKHQKDPTPDPLQDQSASTAVKGSPNGKRTKGKGSSLIGDRTRTRANSVLSVLQSLGEMNELLSLLHEREYGAASLLLEKAEGDPALRQELRAMCGHAACAGSTVYRLPLHEVLGDNNLPSTAQIRLLIPLLKLRPEAAAIPMISVQRLFESPSVSVLLRSKRWVRATRPLSNDRDASSLRSLALLCQASPDALTVPVFNSRSWKKSSVAVWATTVGEEVRGWGVANPAERCAVQRSATLLGLRDPDSLELFAAEKETPPQSMPVRGPAWWIASLAELLFLIRASPGASAQEKSFRPTEPDIESCLAPFTDRDICWEELSDEVESARSWAVENLPLDRSDPSETPASRHEDEECHLLPRHYCVRVMEAPMVNAAIRFASSAGQRQPVEAGDAAPPSALELDALKAIAVHPVETVLGLLKFTRVSAFSVTRPTQLARSRLGAIAAEALVKRLLDGGPEENRSFLTEEEQRQYHMSQVASASAGSSGPMNAIRELLRDKVNTEFKLSAKNTPDFYFFEPLDIPGVVSEPIRWIDVKQVMPIQRCSNEYLQDQKQFKRYRDELGYGLVLWMPMVSDICRALCKSVAHATLAQPETDAQGFGALLPLRFRPSRFRDSAPGVVAGVSREACRKGRLCTDVSVAHRHEHPWRLEERPTEDERKRTQRERFVFKQYFD